MTQTRTAYMPLASYPEVVADASIQAAVAFVPTLGSALDVTTFSVDIPHVPSALGSLVIDVPGIVRSAEEKSKTECRRLESLVRSAAGSPLNVSCATREVILGAALDIAAAEARYFDLSVLPWSGEIAAQDMIHAVVFGSGRPTILVPPSVRPTPLDHIAIAWDASRFAARALGDALPFLAAGGRVTVLTVRDEKPLSGPDLAGALASALAKRGFTAKPLDIPLGGKSIAEVLQDTALSEGAKLLAMGGFGHSRVRDFILGGATKGLLGDLRLPTLLSH